MTKTKLGLLVAQALCCLPAVAADEPKADWTITGNAALYSDYRFRGYTQTGYGPAFQGGFDIAHKSGFYAGNWNSNVEQGLYTGASLEMDLYGGYKGQFGGFDYDVGYLYYYYPNSGAAGSVKAKNGELYAGASYGPLSAKWYYATTKFFSLGKATATNPDIDTKGSWYLDLAGSLDFGGGWGGNAHVGYQKIENGKTLFANGLIGANKNNAVDYKIGATKDLAGWLFGLAIVGTSESDLFRTAESLGTRGAGKTKFVASVGKTF